MILKAERKHFFIFLFTLIFSFASYAQKKEIIESSWAKTKQDKKGTITVYWDQSKPFIFMQNNKMGGIECDLIEGFKGYLKTKYNISLKINWKKAESFANTYKIIQDTSRNGIFGVSAFSITRERNEIVDFSPPYMSDISVLITSKNIPIVKSYEEFKSQFSKLNAITIKETTYEKELLRLKDDQQLSFPIFYIPSNHNILRTIESRDDAFGFIDLPVYMMMFKDNPSINIKRQNLFPLKGEGYGIIYPKNSDWYYPIEEYFTSDEFNKKLKNIIGKYIDADLYAFIENLAVQSNNDVILLTKEKEIQQNDLLVKANQIAVETRTRNYLILLSAIIFVFLVMIIVLYRKQNEQKEKIETQQKSIEQKNEELEKRNEHLLNLNEEKNNLIRILIHDLRTPVNHIQGLARIFSLENPSLGNEQKILINQISESAVRINKMILSILDIDALENNRVQIKNENVLLYPLLSQIIKEFDKQAQKKDIRISLQAVHHKLVLQADPLFLAQIFENLLSNAIKFSEKGKSVEIKLKENDHEIMVCIKDQGPGLSDEDKARMYKKFERLTAKPTDGESSTGLGLSIVKKYVELMNGEIHCDSILGEGATFSVKFKRMK